jgi:hypothetical protein
LDSNEMFHFKKRKHHSSMVLPAVSNFTFSTRTNFYSVHR